MSNRSLARSPQLVIVPGFGSDHPDHWTRALLSETPGASMVHWAPRFSTSAERVAHLDRALDALPEPPILVAHCMGVLTVAHWSQVVARPIAGALLATPPDLEQPLTDQWPTRGLLTLHGWLPTPMKQLRFPTILAASRNDPLARFSSAEAMAHAWGSSLVDIGEAGHLDVDSGFGPWPRVHSLIRELMDRDPGCEQRCGNA